MSDTPKRRKRGERWAEFLLLGGATLFLLPLSWAARSTLGLSTPELVVGFTTFYGAHVINDPHFSATYLLFYERLRQRAFGREYSSAQRLRYWLAGFAAPLLLLAWAFWAIVSHSALALGMLMELMFFLVGWHYVKQGFGVFAVLSARRGAGLEPGLRRALRFHCLAGWLLAWVNPSRDSIEVFEKGVVYWTLPRPALLEQLAFGTFALSTVMCAVALTRRFRSDKPKLPLAGLCGLLVSVWLWSVLSSVDPLLVYLIPALHSVQYLYFVHLLRKNRARLEEGPPMFGPPATQRLWRFAASALILGLVLFHALPTALDALLVDSGVTAVGPTPYFAGLFACVNIHHYLMDAVIWRRENPETSYLMADISQKNRAAAPT